MTTGHDGAVGEQGGLFGHPPSGVPADASTRGTPLAARMRPRSLDELVGQEHLVGPGTPLRRAIESDGLTHSIILWGPPGSGKTSLAAIIARSTRAHFETLSAVLAGVADIRRVVAEARRRRAAGRRTILFVDEIHRFNRAQQDALLPHVEDGTVVLVGATTENPFFEVVGPLLSRARVLQLRPLEPHHVRQILERALSDPERGLGRMPVQITSEALDYLAAAAEGDARNALNALEMAVGAAMQERCGREGGEAGPAVVDLQRARHAMQRRSPRYDRTGDEHYDTISAFIKSVRGSDPDAALFWLARMMRAGEDPRFVMRRLLILAAEDVGLADPQAVVVTAACARALEWVGLPEAQYHLALATLYLALAPKSNSTGAYFEALADLERLGQQEVPDHLKDAHRDAARMGHGRDYLYPHDFPGHWVAQAYLPEALRGRRYYRPSDQGDEPRLYRQLLERRGESGQGRDPAHEA
ncbi:replication-associated recombination protein A [Geochorda subterranea]|uniref:Replication-associated recombination protein A n=1 Tax=Geochorda subterranea TaxID=3109564 RepID=A0ABZ1BLZ8_9FIRM|nr:replication-associated recombination protein A [Limnochorda sp. LNt]WRP13486.1 replication-associated recombination protein A [Limnochorda sp. LNt]